MVVDVVFLEVGEKESRLCLFHTRLLLFSHQFLFFFFQRLLYLFSGGVSKVQTKATARTGRFFPPFFLFLLKKKKKKS